MEYVLNWMVLLLSLGAIVLVVLVCYADFKRGAARPVEATAPMTEVPVQSQVQSEAAPGPFLELSYRRNGQVEYVQKVYAGQKGYIGTETYPGLGAGMPVRHVEILGYEGEFSISNLDWQMPVSVRDGSREETEAQIGQTVSIEDGSEIKLSGGWTVDCRLSEATEG